MRFCQGYKIPGYLTTAFQPAANPTLLLSLLPLTLLLRYLTRVEALGSQCSAPLGDGNAAENEPYWLEKMKHQGLSAYNNDPASYTTFRNVKDFGAMGDGLTDDTQAILSVNKFPYLCVVANRIY